MTGKRIGYKRVSTDEQNPESQLIGVELDKIFVDIESGYSTKDRQQLKNLMNYVRDDDIVFVECMDRLGRNGDDLRKIVTYLRSNGVQINFVLEGFGLGKKNDPIADLLFDVFCSTINFFSKLAKERQKIGIQKAKKDGKYKGRAKMIPIDRVAHLREQLLTTRRTITDIAKEFKVSRFTIYKYIKEYNIQYERKH